MSSRTTFLGRLLGCFSTVVALAMIAHRETTVEMMATLLDRPVAVFAVGLIGVAAGLAIVLSHNVWSGGALPVIVTLVGWWSLIKGMLCLFLPQGALAAFLGGPSYDRFYYVSPAISLMLGLYLIYASGFADPEPAH
ncbi:MAG TPA: hypothetical protein VGN01_10595 [Acidobacteriaceae bacterium]